MKRICIILANGSEDMEVVIPYDLWNRAGLIVKLLSIHKKKNVSLAHGTKIISHELLANENLSKYNGIYIPGGLEGVKNILNPQLAQKLHAHIKNNYQKQDITFISICAGPTVFSELGLPETIKMTCYPGFEKHLGKSYVKKDVVINKNFITATGPAKAFDLALAVIKKFVSPNKAKEIAKNILKDYK